MHAQEPSVIENTSARRGLVNEQNAFPTRYPQGAQTKLSEARPPQPQGDIPSIVECGPRSQSAVAVSASQSKLDLPVLKNRSINAIHTAFSHAW